MSNEQRPNQWSGEGQSPERAPQFTNPTAYPGPQQQPGYQPASPGSAGPGWGPPAPRYTQSAPPPPYGGYRPSGSQQYTPPTGPDKAQQARDQRGRRGSRAAGVLALLLLAGGVGGGAGLLAANYDPQAGAPTVTTETETSGTGTQTTVVQGDPTNPDWAAVADVAAKAVVAIQVQNASGSGGQGSGVIIDGDGHIVTNNHVVSGQGAGAQIRVLEGNVSYEAELIGTDPSTDLAVIKLIDPPSDLSVMAYGDATDLTVGDPVMAIGNPLGLDDTVTTGIVSALNRPVTTRAITDNTVSQSTGPDVVVTAAVQTNAAINPGNSGGALVNTSGELVGIPSSIASLPTQGQGQAGNIGLGFAIGVDQVSHVVEQLIDRGYAEHPQLGVSAANPTEIGPMGAVIAQVVAGSPAEQAGILVDDLITEVDGQPVSSTESLVALVRAGRVGEEMELTVVRQGSEMTITVVPVAAPR